MSKKKILQIGYVSLAKAGIQTVIMNIARGVHEDFDIDVLITSCRKGYYDEEFLKYGRIYRVDCSVDGVGTLRRYLRYAIRPFKQFFYTRKLIKQNGYDIVHIHPGLDAGAMFLAAKSAGVRHIVAHSHNSASPEKRTIFSRAYRALTKYIIHKVATVRIGVSADASSYLYGNDESFVVNNPVDIEKFEKVTRNTNDNEIILTNVGRYCYQKNQAFILEILKELIKMGVPVKLNLVGFGEGEKKLKKQIEDYKLFEYVSMIDGNNNCDIPAVLSETDMFVFPSTFEGLGIGLIEAQAARCMCIASNVVPKETDLGMCEYLSLDEKPSVWAEKIMEMINSEDRYQVREDLLCEYRADVVQQNVRELYHRLVTG